jgi:hypothetical protein
VFEKGESSDSNNSKENCDSGDKDVREFNDQ